MSDQTYWAAADSKDIAANIRDKASKYYQYVNSIGLMTLWRNSDRLCYGLDVQGGWARSTAMRYGGQEGEIALVRGNHYASLGQSIVSMATGTRLSLQPQAVNNDYESEIATDLARGLLDYYYQEKEIEDRFIEALECMLFAGEAWLGLTWDEQKGELFAFEPQESTAAYREAPAQKPVYEGDVACHFKHPVDIVRDYRREDLDAQWIIVRCVLNRWDLLADYPQQASEILGASLYDNAQQSEWLWPVGEERTGETADLVTGWYLYHMPTPAMPVGRQTLVVGSAVLKDDVLQYKRLPYVPMAAWRKRKSAFGWSRMWDLIGVQQAYDSVLSTMTTNHDITGLVNIWTRTGDDIITEDASGGARHLQSAEPPQVIEMNGIGQGSIKLEEIYGRLMETLSGVNATSRGNVPSNLNSGAGLALVHAMALEFNSPIQRAFGRGVERGMTLLVEILQKYANTPRFAQIVGKDKAPELKQFQGSQLQPIRRVTVDLGAAMTRTITGRQQLADNLLAQKVIDGRQYMNVVRTGRLDDIETPNRSSDLNMKSENEMMMSGKTPKALPTDNHKEHIISHKAVLDNPKFRENEMVAAAVIAHIQQHEQLWIGTSPALLVLSGQDPPDPSLLPPDLGGGFGMPPGAGGAPEAGGKKPPGGDGAKTQKAQVPGVSEDQNPALAAKLPRMPQNPLESGNNQPASKG